MVVATVQSDELEETQAPRSLPGTWSVIGDCSPPLTFVFFLSFYQSAGVTVGCVCPNPPRSTYKKELTNHASLACAFAGSLACVYLRYRLPLASQRTPSRASKLLFAMALKALKAVHFQPTFVVYFFVVLGAIPNLPVRRPCFQG